MEKKERQSLSQSRQEWKKVDGAAFPELGHQHAKIEDERINLKHQEAKFESRQKKYEHKRKRALEKFAKLTKKAQGRDVVKPSVYFFPHEFAPAAVFDPTRIKADVRLVVIVRQSVTGTKEKVLQNLTGSRQAIFACWLGV